MSFSCGVHGWRHGQSPCPYCKHAIEDNPPIVPNTVTHHGITTISQHERRRIAAEKKSRAPLSLSHVDLDKVNRRLLTVLNRDVEHLLTDGYEKKLGRDDSYSLVSYLRLMKELMRREEEATQDLTDAELEKIANQIMDEDGEDNEDTSAKNS